MNMKDKEGNGRRGKSGRIGTKDKMKKQTLTLGEGNVFENLVRDRCGPLVLTQRAHCRRVGADLWVQAAQNKHHSWFAPNIQETACFEISAN